MRKLAIVVLAALVVLGASSSSFALLCASDQVPAGTLLFPFMTGTYSPASTPTNPVTNYDEARSLFAITNVSSSAKIVHLVLWNDMSVVLLDWSILLTGYDVITFDFGRIMEGWLVPTGNKGSRTAEGTGATEYSPVGASPGPQGPVPSWFVVPGLPAPQEVTRYLGNGNYTYPTPWNSSYASVHGLCANSDYTDPFAIDPTLDANRIPEYNRSRVYRGLRQSQRMADNGWWVPAGAAFTPPDWLLLRSTSDPIWGYITADVVSACNLGFPGSPLYFSRYARPVTTSLYANGFCVETSNGVGAACPQAFQVDLGNTLIGDWFTVDPSDNYADGNPAVHIEFDNQDVVNSIEYPQTIDNGASFYRYKEPECTPEADNLGTGSDGFNLCSGFFSGTDNSSSDFVAGAPYYFGHRNGEFPSNDFREPLPSAFAVRWLEGVPFDGTWFRVWKEFPDIYPYYGLGIVYSAVEYAYYSWDEQERVVSGAAGCQYSPCPQGELEGNELPLEVQEVSSLVFNFPRNHMDYGWVIFAFMGSNTILFDNTANGAAAVPNGYSAPLPRAQGTQAWIDVVYKAAGAYSVGFSAAILGNFLCDGYAIAPDGRIGSTAASDMYQDVTDLGDVFY